MIRIAINGFGRIGRLTFRELLKKEDVEIVAINDLTEPATLHHLLKFDSIHGRFPHMSHLEDNVLEVNGMHIKMLAEKEPEKLPWKELRVDIVLECTGIFRDRKGLQKHLDSGAGKVILSAPAQGEMKTIVLGVNDHILNAEDRMVSNASCTTNCLAPMVKVLHNKFGIVRGFMTTVHAYTSDQNLQDAPHRDLRRARAAALSIIPTSTGAATAVALVMPELQGKLEGFAMRVPTPTGSVTDFTAVLEKNAGRDEVNQAMREAAESDLKGIMEYSTDPLVSADIVGNPYSCIFDSELTLSDENLVKVVGWYDNEAGYSARLADLAVKMGNI